MADDPIYLPNSVEELSLQAVNESNTWFDPLIGFLQTGGPVVWVLSGMSVLALSMFLIKLWQLISSGANRLADVETSLEYWGNGEIEKAQQSLVLNRPISHVVSIAMGGLAQPHSSEDRLTQELTRVAQMKMVVLRSLLRPLEVIASLAPLLGLLGTVLGMITAFQRMEAAGSQVDPSVLSGGIWQALLTTAVGLCVAIPVVMLHSWLERKVDSIGHKMNDAVTRVFTHRPSNVLQVRKEKGMVANVA